MNVATGEAEPEEQLADGAARELREETVDDQGKPVQDIDPSRLVITRTGIDYRNPNLPVAYSGHVLELNKEEYQTISEHGQKLANDSEYLKGVQSHAWDEGLNLPEVTGYEVMPLAEAKKLSPELFVHQFSNIRIVLGDENVFQVKTSKKFKQELNELINQLKNI